MQNHLQLVQNLGNGLGLGHLDRVDLGGDHPRSGRAADRRHVDDGAVVNGLKLGGELVFIAVFLQFVAEVEALDELVAGG